MIDLISRMARRLSDEPVASPVPLPGDVEFRRSRLVPRIAGVLSGMDGPAAAVTLGRIILVGPEIQVSERLARHELAHVRQWELEPRAFPFRYIAAHIRHGYDGNPYEAEARAAEARSRAPGERT